MKEKRYLLSRSERELGTHIDLRLLQVAFGGGGGDASMSVVVVVMLA